ncbi:MAG: ABC transporter substrate-binding protein [Clostridia bacterium]|nr:ABC transporter substrate-binding protein [Clostridia bacterium]
MKKIIRFIALSAALLLMAGGCALGPAADESGTVGQEETSGSSSDITPASFPHTFTDSMGNKVTLDRRPSRVAVLFASYAEIWKLSGGEIAVTVGDSITRGFAAEGTPVVHATSGMKIDREALVAANPDFVIISSDLKAQLEAGELMKELGVPVAAFREDSFEDYMSMLKLFCEINGSPEAYAAFGTDVRDSIEKLLGEAPERSFSYLFIRAGSAFSSTSAQKSADHFACDILNALGGRNIADDFATGTDSLSLEAVIAAGPEFIFAVAKGDEEAAFANLNSILASDGWSSLTAVKEGRVIYLEKDLYNLKPNQKWAEAYVKLEKLLSEKAGR